MISKEEIKKLADLARIDLPDAEIAELVGEMDSILEFVSQVKEITKTTAGAEIDGLKNVMRDDTNPTEPETYSKDLIVEFPDKEGDYLKVKKIL